MSIEFTDAKGRSLKLNAWNWGALHFSLVCCKPKLFENDQVLERLRFGGVELDEDQAAEIKHYLIDVILPRMRPGQRMLPDFTVTDVPDDGLLHRDDLKKNYSLQYDALVGFICFLDAANPPIKVSG